MTDLEYVERIKEFSRDTIGEYNHSINVKNFVPTNSVEEEQATEDYFQIAIRPLIDINMFLPQKGSTFLSTHIIGLGRSISLGEINYLADKLINNSKIRTENVKLRDITYHKLNEFIGDLSARIIVPPNVKRDWVLSKEWRPFLTFKGRTLILPDETPLLPLSSKTIGERIIIIDETSCLWRYALFENQYTNLKERIKIIVGKEKAGKIDVIIKSLNKFEIYDSSKIKILNLI